MPKILLNKNTSIDLATLINSRLLIQANSGGGKSWLLRRILEQSHGQVQQIIIDLEGEFSTLREKHDYILAGKGGDVSADPKSAALLARKLLELNVSAIIDLYELKHQERKHFVKLFLDAMINAPKELWHPCLVIVDEAHQFCPEKGQSEAMDSVIDLATRGRKRGYCVVLATQRLSKLHKDAAAECNNKLIGRTGLDIDMKRASEELGFTSKQQYLSLRDLDAGEFFAFGPAISKKIVKLKVGDVHTTHPTIGSKMNIKVAPPTDKVKKAIQKLGDLPEAAYKEAHTIAEHIAVSNELRRELRVASQGVPSQERIDIEVKRALAIKERETQKDQIEFQKQLDYVFKSLERINIICHKVLEKPMPEPRTSIKEQSINFIPIVSKEKSVPIVMSVLPNDTKSLTGGALRMLKVLVSRYPMALSKTQLATFSRLSPRSGTFNTYLSLLKSKEFILVEKGLFTASPLGIDEIGEIPNPPQTNGEIIEMWQGILKGGARRMFDVLSECYPEALTKEELGERTNLSPGSGTFNTYLSMLRGNALIKTDNGDIIISENFFL